MPTVLTKQNKQGMKGWRVPVVVVLQDKTKLENVDDFTSALYETIQTKYE